MRKWQRDRQKRRSKTPAPAGDQPAPLRPTYPEIQEPQPDGVEHHSGPAAEPASAPAPQRRKRGGRRKKKAPAAAPEPVAERAEPTQAQESSSEAEAAAPAPPATRARRRRGGTRKRAQAPEPAPSAPVEPLPEIVTTPPVEESPAAEPAQELETQVEEAVPESQAEPALAPEFQSAPEVPEPVSVAAVPEFPPELKPVQVAPAQAQRRPKGVVVLAIGLPGSGKTTWFKRRGVTPLSSDLLRTILFDNITEQRYQNLVFGTLRSLLRARLIARMPWNYVDATNLSPRERRHWIQMARSFGFEVHAVFFDVPLEVCLERNRRRQRIVPEEIMQRMAAKLRAPRFEEGFSKITVVRIKKQPRPQ